MNEQPEAEALYIADELDAEFAQGRISNYNGRKAAAELRRLHNLCAEWEKKAAIWLASPEAAKRLDGYRELAQRVDTLEAALRQAVEALNTARPACFAETTTTAIDEAITTAKQTLGGKHD